MTTTTATPSRRVRSAPADPLDAIFSPKSIAVCGVTASPGTVPFDIFYNILISGFKGTLYPIAPGKRSICAVRAYRYVIDIEDDVDAAVIVFPSDVVARSLEQCAQKGIKAVTIISAGFREVGPAGVDVTMIPVETAQSPLARRIEGVWFYIYSLFYVGIWNFLLGFTALVLLGGYLYDKLFRDRSYYPSYDTPDPVELGRPLRIAMFTNSYLPFTGGLPLSVERLKRGLEAQGHEVLVVCPSYGTIQTEPSVWRVPALAREGSMIRLANPFHLRTWKRLKEFDPDVIHLHHPFWLGTLGLRLARRLKVPAVFTYHTRLEHFAHIVPLPGALFRNVVAHWIINRFANRCDSVIVPTPVTRDYIRLIGVHVPVDVQPTGVETELYCNQDPGRLSDLRAEANPDGRLLLVTAARLSPEKNLPFILRAMAALRARGAPSFRLLVLGEGDERAALEAMIEDLDLHDCVRLMGAVPSEEVPSWLMISDIFVFASAAETQGMVVLEAMAAGLPVVAVNSSGIDAFVENRETGYATPETLEIWTETLHGLMVSNTKREVMGGAAREAAMKHSVEAFSASVLTIYEAAISRKTASQKKDV